MTRKTKAFKEETMWSRKLIGLKWISKLDQMVWLAKKQISE